jgi:hypothetical protein
LYVYYKKNVRSILFYPERRFMKIPLDPHTLHKIPDSKRVREEKVPYALSSPQCDPRPQLPIVSQGLVAPPDLKFPESDELHLLELQVSAYLLETALTAAELPAREAAAIRERFCGRIFDLQDLRAAIEDIQAHTTAHTWASSVKEAP